MSRKAVVLYIGGLIANAFQIPREAVLQRTRGFYITNRGFGYPHHIMRERESGQGLPGHNPQYALVAMPRHSRGAHIFTNNTGHPAIRSCGLGNDMQADRWGLNNPAAAQSCHYLLAPVKPKPSRQHSGNTRLGRGETTAAFAAASIYYLLFFPRLRPKAMSAGPAAFFGLECSFGHIL